MTKPARKNPHRRNRHLEDHEDDYDEDDDYEDEDWEDYYWEDEDPYPAPEIPEIIVPDIPGVLVHATEEELNAGLERIQRAPNDIGVLLMIVRRPDVDKREIIRTGELDVDRGLVGDNWKERGSTSTPDGQANSDAQITIINLRVLELVAQLQERWALSGDQLVIDINLSEENMPPGTRIAIGTAILEVSDKPHTGCAKFAQRFGKDALRFVSTPTAMKLRLRGVNTRIVKSGTIRPGDAAKKLEDEKPEDENIPAENIDAEKPDAE